MIYFLVRYGDDCNPIELLSAKQLTDIYRKAEEFDGFTGLSMQVKLTEADLRELHKQLDRLTWKHPQDVASSESQALNPET